MEKFFLKGEPVFDMSPSYKEHQDKCAFRITLVLLLDIILLMGWVLAAEKMHSWLVWFFPIIQFILMMENTRNWNMYSLFERPQDIIDILPIFMWAIIAPTFPAEAMLFATLQTAQYVARKKWVIPYGLYAGLRRK